MDQITAHRDLQVQEFEQIEVAMVESELELKDLYVKEIDLSELVRKYDIEREMQEIGYYRKSLKEDFEFWESLKEKAGSQKDRSNGDVAVVEDSLLKEFCGDTRYADDDSHYSGKGAEDWWIGELIGKCENLGKRIGDEVLECFRYVDAMRREVGRRELKIREEIRRLDGERIGLANGVAVKPQSPGGVEFGGSPCTQTNAQKIGAWN